MPDFQKQVCRTEEALYLHHGIAGMTLAELAKDLDTRLKNLIKKHGPEARVELLYKDNLYNLYITRPAHLESDQEYNERVIKEIKQGK